MSEQSLDFTVGPGDKGKPWRFIGRNTISQGRTDYYANPQKWNTADLSLLLAGRKASHDIGIF